LVVVLWSQVVKPGNLNQALLAKDGEVVCSLLAGGYHHDLFVLVSKQDPQHEGGSDPALPKSAKGLYLQAFWSFLKVSGYGDLGPCWTRQV
jgi:hypothetical protein